MTMVWPRDSTVKVRSTVTGAYISVDGEDVIMEERIFRALDAGDLLLYDPSLGPDELKYVPGNAGTLGLLVSTHLSTMIGLYPSHVVSCVGGDEAGDGKEGQFAWRPSSNAAHDGVDVIQVGTRDGRWHRVSSSQRRASIEVCPDDFGAVGTGAEGTEAANDVAFVAMRDFALAAGAKSAKITFGFGKTYRLTTTRWLLGLSDYVLDLNGSTLWNVHSNLAARTVLQAVNIFQTYSDTDLGANLTFSSYITGYEIATVEAGHLTLNMLTPAQAGNFAPGEPILIAGYEHQVGGFPPNFQFFEWTTVASVDATAGTVNLQAPTRFRYSSAWPDRLYNTPLNVGKARIFKLVGRTTTPARTFNDMARRIVIRNGHIRGNNNNQRLWVVAYESVLWENITTDLPMYTVAGARTTLRNVRLLVNANINTSGTLEVDKLIEYMSFEDCTIPVVGGGTGALMTVFDRCKLPSLNYQGFNTVISSCDLGPPEGVVSPAVMCVGRTSFIGSTCRRATSTGITKASRSISARPWSALAAGLTVATVPSSNTVTFVSATAFSIGSILLSEDGLTMGKVMDCAHPKTYTVHWGYGGDLVAPGLKFWNLPDWTISVDHHLIGPRDKPFEILNPYEGVLDMKLPSFTGTFQHLLSVPGLVNKITINVLKAGSAGVVEIRRGFLGATDLIMRADCTATGERVLERGVELEGTVGGDFFASSLIDVFQPDLRIYNTGLSADRSNWPEITLKIEIEPWRGV